MNVIIYVYILVFFRCFDNYLATILVLRNMLSSITIDQKYRKHSMPTLLKFLISGLLAGESMQTQHHPYYEPL